MSSNSLSSEKDLVVTKLTVAHPEGPESSSRHWNRKERKEWMIALFFGCCVLYASRNVMPVCIPTIAKEQQWDKTDSGSVLSAFFWGYCLTQVIGGYMSDKVGGEIVLVSAAIGWALVTVWTPVLINIFPSKSLTLWVQVISRVLLGCCQGVHYPGVTSIVADRVSESEKAFTYSTICAGAQLGTLFVGSAGSLLLTTYGWHAPFYVIGCLGIIWLLVLRYYLIAKQRRKANLLSLDNLPSSPLAKAAEETKNVPWTKILKARAFWAMVMSHMAHTCIYFILINWMPTYFEETFPDAKKWVFNVLPWMITIPSAMCGGAIADRMIKKGVPVLYARKAMHTVGNFFPGLFLFMLWEVKEFASALTIICCVVVCCSFHFSAVLVNPQDLAPDYAGSVFGIMNMAGAISAFFGTYIAGHLMETTKSWLVVWTFTGIISWLGWSVFFFFGSAKRIA